MTLHKTLQTVSGQPPGQTPFYSNIYHERIPLLLSFCYDLHHSRGFFVLEQKCRLRREDPAIFKRSRVPQEGPDTYPGLSKEASKIRKPIEKKTTHPLQEGRGRTTTSPVQVNGEMLRAEAQIRSGIAPKTSGHVRALPSMFEQRGRNSSARESNYHYPDALFAFALKTP